MNNPFQKVTSQEWKEFNDKLKLKDIAIDVIDINSLSAKDTTAEVLYDFCKNEYGISFSGSYVVSVSDLKAQQNKMDMMMKAEMQKQEAEAEKEFMKSLEQIENDKTTDIIEEIYYIPKQFVKMVIRGHSTGLVLWGEAGLGKTYSTLRTFKEENVDFVISSGFSTPLEFYTFLWENRARHIIFDDVGNLLRNPIILELLKSALYSPKGTRIVSYNTTSYKLSVPQKFEFTGSIIILINKLSPQDEDVKAVLDRIMHYELKLDYKTKLRVLTELIKQDYRELTMETRVRIMNWIRANTTPATTNLNLRLLFKIYEICRFDREGWEKLAIRVIDNDKNLLRVKEILNRNISIKNAVDEFIEKGFGSRATFFRLKKGLEG